MRRRLVVILATVVGVLVTAAGALFAYDRAGRDTIAAGVEVGGIDVGGLSKHEAAAKLRRAVLEPLRQPIVVRASGHRFTLTPKTAKVRVDIDGSIAAAVAAGRDGNVLSRSYRRLSGGSLDDAIPLDIRYSKRGVKRLLSRVSETVDKPAVDATVNLDAGDPTPQPSELGRRVMVARLRAGVQRRLTDATAARTVKARTAVVEPKVSTKDLVAQYPAFVMVDRANFELTLYKDLEPVKTYGIAVGQVGLETPAGLYHIQNKAVDPAWHVPRSDWAGDLAGKVIPAGPKNPIKARWMGIYDGAGIHGTDATGSIGTAASHGCIRMRIPDVIELYDQVPIDAPIYIA